MWNTSYFLEVYEENLPSHRGIVGKGYSVLTILQWVDILDATQKMNSP